MKPEYIILALTIIVILFLTSACSALNLVIPPPAPGDAAGNPASDSAEGHTLSGPNPAEGPASSGPNPAEGPASSGPNPAEGPAEDGPEDPQHPSDPGDIGEELTCFNSNSYVLSFDHAFTVNQQGTSLTHILNQGELALLSEVTYGDHDAILSTTAPQTLNYEYMGVLGPCSVEAGGTTVISAEGYCDLGVVYLNITEDWSDSVGSMTCYEAVLPFSAPGYAYIHSGASGLGEEFLITDDSSGYTVLREFLGGEGYHSWTLSVDVSLVPLVDGE